LAFTMGKSTIAREAAFTKKGRSVKFLWFFLRRCLRWKRSVESISSWNVKKGMERDSVIVFVIALRMPVSFFTWSSGFTPVSGAIFGTFSPAEEAGVDTGLAGLVPLRKVKISSFMTLLSLPVPGTSDRSMLCFFAMLLTAGVARTLWLASCYAAVSVLAAGLPLQAGALTGSYFFAGSAAGVEESSATSISMRALPTRQISSLL